MQKKIDDQIRVWSPIGSIPAREDLSGIVQMVKDIATGEMIRIVHKRRIFDREKWENEHECNEEETNAPRGYGR